MEEIFIHIINILAITGFIFFPFVVIYKWIQRRRREEIQDLKDYIDRSHKTKSDIESTLFSIDEAKNLKPGIDILTVCNRYRKTKNESIYMDVLTESPVLNTTFPNLTGLPVFMDSKDDIELKRNSQISEAIQIFTGFIASEKVSL